MVPVLATERLGDFSNRAKRFQFGATPNFLGFLFLRLGFIFVIH